jgi:hypothetical protein
MGLVFKGPLLTASHAQPNGEEISREGYGNHKESNDTAQFGTAGKLIQENEAQENDDEHAPL